MDTKLFCCFATLCISSVIAQFSNSTTSSSNSTNTGNTRPEPGVVASLSGGSQRVEHIGNPHIGRAAGVDKGGVTFLLDDVILSEGVVFAFAAYFRNEKPAAFQLWRPVGSGGKQFKLISTLTVTPAVDKDVEQIYIESKLDFNSCVRVYKEDRIGVYFPTDEGSVAYAFDPAEPSALLYESPDAAIPVNLSQEVDFTSLNFPYDFSMSAYIDTEYPNLATYEADRVLLPCPANLLIPEHIHDIPDVTTRAPPTGAPGATGPAGPQGIPGDIGATGWTGPQGDLGFTGFTGPVGAAGSTGFTGPQGATGNSGMNGVAGVAGPQGPKGDKGDQGPPGPTGSPGKVVYVNSNGTAVKDPNNVDSSSSTSASSDDDDSNILWIILLIWIIILTIILIVLIVILCVIRKKYYMVRKDGIYGGSDFKSSWVDSMENGKSTGSGSLGSGKTDATLVNGNGNAQQPSSPNRPVSTISGIQQSWMGTLKDDRDADYENATIRTVKDEDKQDTDSAKYMNVEESFPTDSLTRKPKDVDNTPTIRTEDIHPEV